LTCWRPNAATLSFAEPLDNQAGRTGNFVKFARWARFCTLARKQIQRLAAKFPTQPNREFLQKNREFVRANREFEPVMVRSDFRDLFFSGAAQGHTLNLS
jgi:hypothetical protein